MIKNILWGYKWLGLLTIYCIVTSCSGEPINNPYPSEKPGQSILYSSFSERPKHLDPAKAYSSNEYAIIAQIYEAPLQYHYLKRPYQLIPQSAVIMPEVSYLDADLNPLSVDAAAQDIVYTDYKITLRQDLRFQPHPAFAQDVSGAYLYHHLSNAQLREINSLMDFAETGSRPVLAKDYVYQVKRLANPAIHSPIAEIMKQHIVGLSDFAKHLLDNPGMDLRQQPLHGVEVLGDFQYRIRIHGKYPQFLYWLAMPFFTAMPWEADQFYGQPGLQQRNITLDWFPIGSGPYQLAENNPNLRMSLLRNPNFHEERYPEEGEQEDHAKGLLQDAGKKLPFIDKVVYTLEKENIPYWNKFLQGYYDASGIASDSFDQAIQFSGMGEAELTPFLQGKGVKLQTAVTSSIYYMGFNMLDTVVGGNKDSARKLRQALSIAIDYEEYISIFMNGRGLAAQGILPPGIYGYKEGKPGMNSFVYDWQDNAAQRKSLDQARQLLKEAGYDNGRDPVTGEALILYLDTASSGSDGRAQLNWYRKQFARIGIQLVIRATDYNRFQQKMRNGNAQIFMWGWNADYPDPENFFFLLYGPNSKVKHGGENAVNYENKQFDQLFELMRNMNNGEQRFHLIQQMQEIIRRDAPWIFGFHPMSFSLSHSWYQNLKPNLMANNRLKYTKIDSQLRKTRRYAWNQPVLWPLWLGFLLLIALVVPAWRAWRKRNTETLS